MKVIVSAGPNHRTGIFPQDCNSVVCAPGRWAGGRTPSLPPCCRVFNLSSTCGGIKKQGGEFEHLASVYPPTLRQSHGTATPRRYPRTEPTQHSRLYFDPPNHLDQYRPISSATFDGFHSYCVFSVCNPWVLGLTKNRGPCFERGCQRATWNVVQDCLGARGGRGMLWHYRRGGWVLESRHRGGDHSNSTVFCQPRVNPIEINLSVVAGTR